MRTRLGALAILSTLSLVTVPAAAQTPWGPEFVVNTYTTDTQSRPAAAMLRDGSSLIVWQSVRQDDAIGVFARRYAFDGTPVGPEFLVNGYVTGVQQAPQVAGAPSGGFVVTWSGTGPGDENGIFARLHDRAGVPAGPEFLVNTTTAGEQFQPAVAAGGPGGFVVVWSSLDGSLLGVFGQRYDASGARIGAEFQVNTYTTDSQYTPHVAMAPDGRFVVVWTSIGQDGTGLGVYGQRFDAAGARAGMEFRVNTATTGNESEPRIACDGAANFAVVWSGPDGVGPGTFTGVFARRFDPDGTPLGGEFLVHEFNEGGQGDPQIALDAAGCFTVAFVNRPFFLGAPINVLARRFDRQGLPRETTFAVPEPAPTFYNGQPAIASDAVGNLVVAWSNRASDVGARKFGGLHPAAMVLDRVASGTSNGNFVFEPGEAVYVEVAWYNHNGQALTFSGSAASFTGPGAQGDPSYQLLDGTAAYGTVPNGGATTCASFLDCYVLGVTLPTARPAQHWDATLVEDILPVSIGQAKTWALHVGGSFGDVPAASPYYRFVETLLHRSVTAGCGVGTYCPGSSTTREQMAVFVLAAREGAGFLPPACATPVFADVPASSPFCRWIEELARRGVVAGCGGGNYCPSAAVSREEMAVFVLRSLDPALDPPACTVPMFADVPASSPFCRWIEELARRGVVTGCGGGNYCPQAPVTREQMSVFLSLTFGLALYGP